MNADRDRDLIDWFHFDDWKSTFTRGKRRVTSVLRNIENHLLFGLPTTCVKIGTVLFNVTFTHCPSETSWPNPVENWTHDKITNAIEITYRTNKLSSFIVVHLMKYINQLCQMSSWDAGSFLSKRRQFAVILSNKLINGFMIWFIARWFRVSNDLDMNLVCVNSTPM